MFKKLKNKIAEEGTKLQNSVSAQVSDGLRFHLQGTSGGQSQASSQDLEEERKSTIDDDAGQSELSTSKVVPTGTIVDFDNDSNDQLTTVSLSEDTSGLFSLDSSPPPEQPGELTPRKRSDSYNSIASVDSLGIGFLPSIPEIGSASKRGALQPSDLESNAESSVAGSTAWSGASKEQISTVLHKLQGRAANYKDKYRQVARVYNELVKENEKLRTVLTTTQDRALRRVQELKEEKNMQVKSTRHLEQEMNAKIEERDQQIGVLRTQVRLLKEGKPIDDSALIPSEPFPMAKSTEDLSSARAKVKQLENLLTRCKDTIKSNKEKISGLEQQNRDMSAKLEHLESEQGNAGISDLVTERISSEWKEKIDNLTSDHMTALANVEEDAMVKLAEEKHQMHNLIEQRDNEILQCRQKLKAVDSAALAEVETLQDKIKSLEATLQTSPQKEKDKHSKDIESISARHITELAAMEDKLSKQWVKKEQGFEKRLQEQKEQMQMAVEEREMQKAAAVMQLDKKNDDLRTKIEDLETNSISLNSEITKFKDENENLRLELTKKNEENSQVTTQETEALKLSYEAKIDKMKEDYNGEFEALRTSHAAELSNTRVEKDTVIIELEKKFDSEKDRSIAELKKASTDHAKALEDDLNNAKAQLSSLKDSESSSANEKNTLQKNADNLKDSLNTVQAELDRAKNMLDSSTSELDEKAKLLSEYEEQVNSLTKEMTEIKFEHEGKMGEQTGKNEMLGIENAKLKSEISTQQEMMSSLRSDLNSLDSDKGGVIETLNSRIQELELTKNNLEVQVKALEETRLGTVMDLTNAEGKNKQLTLKIDEINSELSNLNTALKTSTSFLKDKDDLLSATKDELNRVVAGLKQQVDSLSQQIAERDNGIENVQAKLVSLVSANEDQKELIEKISAEKLELDRSFENLKSQLVEKEGLVAGRASEMDQLETVVEGYKQKVSNLESQLAEGKRTLEESAKTTVSLQQSITDGAKQIGDLEQKLNAASEKEKTSLKEVAIKDTDLDAMKIEKSRLEESMNEVRQERDFLKTEMVKIEENAKSLVSTIGDEKRDVEEKRLELAQKLEAAEEALNSVDQKSNAFDREIQVLTAQLTAANEESMQNMKSAQAIISEKEIENESLKLQIAALSSQASSAQEDFTKWTDELTKSHGELTDLKTVEALLRESLDDSEHRLKETAVKVTNFQEKLTNNEAEVADLKMQIDVLRRGSADADRRHQEMMQNLVSVEEAKSQIELKLTNHIDERKQLEFQLTELRQALAVKEVQLENSVSASTLTQEKLGTEMEAALAEKLDLVEEVALKTDENAVLEKKMKASEELLKSAHEHVDNLSNELATARTDASNSMDRCRSIESLMKSLTAEHELILNEKDEQLKLLSSEVETTGSNVSEMTRELSQLRIKGEKFEKLKLRYKTLDNEKQSIADQIDQIKADAVQKEEAVVQLRSELGTVKNEKDQLHSKASGLELRLTDSSGASEQLHNSLTNVSSALTLKTAELENKVVEIQTLQADLETSKLNVSELQDNFRLDTEKLSRKHAEQLKNLDEKYLATLTAEKEQLSGHFTESSIRYEKSLEELTEKLRSTEDQLATQLSKVDLLTGQLTTALTEKTQLESTAVQSHLSTSLVAELESSLKQKEVEIRKLNDKVKQALKKSGSSVTLSDDGNNANEIEFLKSEIERLKKENDMKVRSMISQFEAEQDARETSWDSEREKLVAFQTRERKEWSVHQQSTQDGLNTADERFELLKYEYQDQLQDRDNDITKLKRQLSERSHEQEKVLRNAYKKRLDQIEIDHEKEMSALRDEFYQERKGLEKQAQVAHGEDDNGSPHESITYLKERVKQLQNDMSISKEQHQKELDLLVQGAMSNQPSSSSGLENGRPTPLTISSPLRSTTTSEMYMNSVALNSPQFCEPTEAEYLKNILYRYMTERESLGKEAITLAKVITAVMRFSGDQTSHILQKEENRYSSWYGGAT